MILDKIFLKVELVSGCTFAVISLNNEEMKTDLHE